MDILIKDTNSVSSPSSRFRDYLNHYETLGISHTAEPKEIKEAYLTLSKQVFHKN